MLRLIRLITENHYIIVGSALLVGIFCADSVMFLAEYSTLILAIIFFLSSLKIDLSKIKTSLHKTRDIIAVNIITLFVLPIVAYYLTSIFYPQLAIAFLLLSVMPAGMTAPLLTEIVKGKQSLALILTVSTSLLAPITAPLMIKFLIGANIDVSFFDMFWLLAKVIYIPFVLAQIVKKFWQNSIDKVSNLLKPLSVILLGLLIMVIVAKQADTILESLKNGGEYLIYLGLLFGFFFLLHFLGYFSCFWEKEKRYRITVVVCLTYMNFTLAIELANNFFTEPNVIIPVVLSVIPWSIMFIPFKRIMLK